MNLRVQELSYIIVHKICPSAFGRKSKKFGGFTQYIRGKILVLLLPLQYTELTHQLRKFLAYKFHSGITDCAILIDHVETYYGAFTHIPPYVQLICEHKKRYNVAQYTPGTGTFIRVTALEESCYLRHWNPKVLWRKFEGVPNLKRYKILNPPCLFSILPGGDTIFIHYCP